VSASNVSSGSATKKELTRFAAVVREAQGELFRLALSVGRTPTTRKARVRPSLARCFWVRRLKLLRILLFVSAPNRGGGSPLVLGLWMRSRRHHASPPACAFVIHQDRRQGGRIDEAPGERLPLRCSLHGVWY
jgi:hypothetical protein